MALHLTGKSRMQKETSQISKVKKSIITVGICMISALKLSEQAGDKSPMVVVPV